MLIVISPAKTLDFESPLAMKTFTEPELLDRAETIVKRVRTLSTPKVASLMKISDGLARQNVDRYKRWSRPFTPDNARPALYAFRGDVYQGLDADTMARRDVDWAQKHLRILSGLYGVLRPLDLIQPYRLEMGLPLPVGRKPDLYAYWGGAITEAINRAMHATRSRVLVNLASNEYFKSIDAAALEGTVVTPAFKEMRGGTLKMISFSAKRARGLMARFIVENRLKTIEDLQGFASERYKYRKTGSTPDAPLFVRKG